MKTSRLLAAAIFLLTQTLLLLGQTAPNFENGFKLYGSYDGSHLDTVNLMNGNLMLHIPVMPDVSQRGAVTVSHTLFGSSKGWQVICVYGQPAELRLGKRRQHLAYPEASGTQSAPDD